MESLWISVRRWREFQHYDPEKRRPPWIKNYTALVNMDAYLDLSAGCRAVLHGLWLEYASSQCELKFDTRSLSRRLNLRVTKQHLETLNHAGFIDFVASAALADGYHAASAETETETETENKHSYVSETLGRTDPRNDARANGRPTTDTTERPGDLNHIKDLISESLAEYSEPEPEWEPTP